MWASHWLLLLQEVIWKLQFVGMCMQELATFSKAPIYKRKFVLLRPSFMTSQLLAVLLYQADISGLIPDIRSVGHEI